LGWFQESRGALLAAASLWDVHRNHVWSCDFVGASTHEGRNVRPLVRIGEYTRQCLAIRRGGMSRPFA